MQLDANPEANEKLLHNPKDVAQDLAYFIAISKNRFSQSRYSASEWREVLS